MLQPAPQPAAPPVITPPAPIVVPFTILRSGAEQQPWYFTGLVADADQDNRPLTVVTEWAHLKTGDYTIKGLEDFISIERKSIGDLFRTLGQERARFQREHERLAEMDYAAVVIEASWREILQSPPWPSRMSPKAVFRTAMSWSQKYGVQWLAMEDRRLAEITTFRLLAGYWEANGKGKHRRRSAGSSAVR